MVLNHTQSADETAGVLKPTLIAGFCLVLSAYIFLYDIYRPHNVDDPWILSLAYNHTHFGNADDDIFIGPGSGDTRGLYFFRKTHAIIYGSILSIVGWSYSHAQTISFLLVFLSGGLWILILRKMKFGSAFIWTYAALFFLLEFSFATANSLRQEALVMFFQSLGFYLLLSGRPFLSGLVSLIAVETHPIAVINLTLPFVFFIFRKKLDASGLSQEQGKNRFDDRWSFAGGALAGLGYYLLLHPINPGDLFSFVSGHVGVIDKDAKVYLGTLGHYFFSTKYYRHVPEMILFIVSISIWIREKIYRARMEFFCAFWILLVLSFLRDNFQYAVLFYPCLLVILVGAFESIKKLNWALLIVLILMVPQYSAVYYKNRSWDRESYIQSARDLVPQDGLPVVGSATAWFGLMDRPNFKSGLYPVWKFKEKNYKTFYLLDDPFIGAPNPQYKPLQDFIKSNYDARLLKKTAVEGGVITLKKMTVKKFAPEKTDLLIDGRGLAKSRS